MYRVWELGKSLGNDVWGIMYGRMGFREIVKDDIGQQ